jgi:hypothetical protein
MGGSRRSRSVAQKKTAAALGRCQHDASSVTEWKLDKLGPAGISVAKFTDEELIRWWCMQEPTDEGTLVLQGELAEEIERRSLDV